MIPIPKYLKTIAIKVKEKNENLAMHIHCECGCDDFILLKNIAKKAVLTKEQRKILNESKRWYWKEWYPLLAYPNSAAYYYYPELGYREMIIYNCKGIEKRKFDKELDKDRILHYYKINFGDIPLSLEEQNKLNPIDYTTIIKVKCVKCGREHILFDNRFHGCDSADFDKKELIDYDFAEKVFNKNKGKSYKAEIAIKNFWDFEDIESNGNEGLTEDDYSELFGYISIRAIDENNKKIKVHSEELG